MTPDERAAVTPKQFDTWIREAIAVHPDRVNPTVESGRVCCYTDPEDPSRHCLIGEVLAQHDPEGLPDPNGRRNHTQAATGLLHTLGYTLGTATLAGEWQPTADMYLEGGHGARRPWGAVLAVMDERRGPLAGVKS